MDILKIMGMGKEKKNLIMEEKSIGREREASEKETEICHLSII